MSDGDEHTTMKLARALAAIPGVPPDMISRARDGYYHDYLSPLDTPEIQLVTDLRDLASLPATPRNSRPLLRELARQVTIGDFDASKAESDAWAASPEGQETLTALAGGLVPAVPGPDSGDAVKACADLVGRTGARSFECGYLHEGVPAAQAGWYATAVFRGAKITAGDKTSPEQACDELAARLLAGGQCQRCKSLITLTGGPAATRDVTLTDSRNWTAAEQAEAGLCHWRRAGPRWVRGCESPGQAGEQRSG